MHVEQAELVFESKGIDHERYAFEHGNLFDLDLTRYGTFDVVMCLGLMYHVSKPVELFEMISEVNQDILVIDTTLTLARDASFRMRRESLSNPRNSVDYEHVRLPSRRAVTELARQFGYDVQILKPTILDYTGMSDFESGKRRVFFAAKTTDLSQLPADPETPPLFIAPLAKARRLERRALKGLRRAGGQLLHGTGP